MPSPTRTHLPLTRSGGELAAALPGVPQRGNDRGFTAMNCPEVIDEREHCNEANIEVQ